MDTPANEPRFVSCRCQHCDGGIEFDASDFQKGETRNVECPHCKLETLIFVPVQTNASKPKQITTTPSKPNPPAANPSPGQKELFSIKVTSRAAAIFFAFTMFCLASILVWEHLANRSQPVSGIKTVQTSLGSDLVTVSGDNWQHAKYRLDELSFEVGGYGGGHWYKVYKKSNGQLAGAIQDTKDVEKIEAYLHGN
jgi:hypothetical protein